MPPRNRRNPLEVQRNIHFFRTFVGMDQAGRPLAFDPLPVLGSLSEVDHSDIGETGPYLDLADGNALSCWVDEASETGRLRFVRVRRTGLPSLLDRGTLGPLGIAAEAGLAEEIHMVFFGNNIVGSDFNFFGPRASTLAYYFEEKADTKVKLEPLLALNAADRVDRLKDVTLFDLRIRPGFVDQVRDMDDDLGAAFQAASNAGQAFDVQLVLRPRPHSRAAIGDRILGFVRRAARHPRIREEATEFKVRGFDSSIGRPSVIDVLSDRLVTQKRMIRQDVRSRAVIAESAYTAIQEAYSELREELAAAISVRL